MPNNRIMKDEVGSPAENGANRIVVDLITLLNDSGWSGKFRKQRRGID
jgi:hypothetical protein